MFDRLTHGWNGLLIAWLLIAIPLWISFAHGKAVAQVSSTYGPGEAQTIVENCANSLILRCSASENGGTSRFASQLIGDREIVRAEYSYGRSDPTVFSQGGSSVSRNVTHRHVTEAAVMASQIEQLPDLTGFLKLASNPAWTQVALTPRP
jgi:hypothetical protein